MPGRNSKFKSITINEKTFDRLGLSSQKVTDAIEKYLQERMELQSLASKITHVPESVRVYTPFSMKKKGERNEF